MKEFEKIFFEQHISIFIDLSIEKVVAIWYNKTILP